MSQMIAFAILSFTFLRLLFGGSTDTRRRMDQLWEDIVEQGFASSAEAARSAIEKTQPTPVGVSLEKPLALLQAQERAKLVISSEQKVEKAWVEAVSNDGELEKFPHYMIPGVPGIEYPPPSIPNFDSTNLVP